MSETLIGVIVGGIIASIGTIATIIVEARRWKFERKLEHLRLERAKLERLITEIIEQLGADMENNSYSTRTMSDLLVFMPRPVVDRFQTWMSEKDIDEGKARFAYMDLCLGMKAALSEIDKQIERLINA